MERVFAMAMGLLAVTLLLRWGEGRVWRQEVSFPERGLDVVVSSRGALLPARDVAGRGGLYEAIVAGERILVEEGSAPPGLRAACFGPDLEIADVRSFGLSSEPEAAQAFAAWLEELPVPSICILGSSGDLRPVGEGGSARVDAALERLGATARPHHDAPASWAYLGVLLESGFCRLSEVYSRDSGVVLLFTVRPELRSYEGFEGEYTESHIGGPQEVALERDLQRGRIEGAVRLQTETVGGVARAGLAFDPPDGPGSGSAPGEAQASIAWGRVRLGREPFLVSHLAFPETGGSGGRSAVCEVWVDGARVARRELGEGEGWKLWPVDLGAFEGRIVELELRVRSRMARGKRTPVCLWGQPRLLWSGR